MAALEPHIRGTERVRAVFDRVRNGDVSAADLYAEDGVILYGNGGRVEGRDAIREFYKQTIAAIHPEPQVQAVLEVPPLYVAIVDVPSTDRHHRALDIFELDDEGIRKLEIRSVG